MTSNVVPCPNAVVDLRLKPSVNPVIATVAMMLVTSCAPDTQKINNATDRAEISAKRAEAAAVAAENAAAQASDAARKANRLALDASKAADRAKDAADRANPFVGRQTGLW